MIDLEVRSVKNIFLAKVTVDDNATIQDIKLEIEKQHKKLYVDRQSLRATLNGKDIKGSTTAAALKLQNGSKIYVKDLGPQISWRLVFLCEYLGPLVVYLLFTARPWLFYGNENEMWVFSYTARIAAVCWTVHYAKRLLETIFVHRFSHATMPLRNLYKNCGYYWGFTAYVAYHVNHPLYTPPMFLQVLFGLFIFIVCELGNFSIHLLLRDLRPPGSTVRKIPRPNGNPLTDLFKYVSCPNYTYEFGAWVGFSLLTNCIPALIFAIAGVIQMSIWALAKHKAYKKDFSSYPKKRAAIFPKLL